MRRIRTATVLTHARPADTEAAVSTLIELAREAGVTLRFDPEETAKHELPDDPIVIRDAETDPRADLCFALGGDGTILTALRLYAGTGVPVFGINFGEMGFLATVDRDEAWAGTLRALAGDFEVLSLPGIALMASEHTALGFNDVSIHRQQGLRVADLEYLVADDEVGRVRCDGLVISTPAGSTGYNLANGGPVMAWGVHGYVVSFISPHSLTARTLVVAPGDRLAVVNRSREEPVTVIVDGRPICDLAAGDRAETRFVMDQGALAQVPGTTFYHRLRQKFGRLATPF
ncbi:MAG: NAD(+)/NADH kinase [Solirubrobacteraceae bacterium]